MPPKLKHRRRLAMVEKRFDQKCVSCDCCQPKSRARARVPALSVLPWDFGRYILEEGANSFAA